MKKIAIFGLVFLFGPALFIAHSQSLAELAKKEKLRRNKITNARVITAEEAAKYITQSDDSVAAGDELAVKIQTETGDPDEPVDFSGRPESFWRKTMSEARQSVRDLENEQNALLLKQSHLENNFHREDNGFKREKMQREIQKTYYEQDLNRENLEKARDALEDLKKEARKSGALPGWISAK